MKGVTTPRKSAEEVGVGERGEADCAVSGGSGGGNGGKMKRWK